MNPVTGLLALVLLGADKAPAPCAGGKPTRELALSEAIRIALDHAQAVSIRCERVEEDGQVYVSIAPASPGVSPPRFKAEVMALVRSVEQQYWNLVQQHAQLHAAEEAAASARDVLEQAAAFHGTAADAAEAEQRLEPLNLDVVAKTSDAIAAERRLRDVLGLPPAGDRRIVPTTRPVERHKKSDAEVETVRDRLKTASRRRAVAAERLDAQRAFYEEGRISAARYLDAVGEYARAVAHEAKAVAAYNVALAAREQAQGTLLDYRKVTIEEAPSARGTKAVGPGR